MVMAGKRQHIIKLSSKQAGKQARQAGALAPIRRCRAPQPANPVFSTIEIPIFAVVTVHPFILHSKLLATSPCKQTNPRFRWLERDRLGKEGEKDRENDTGLCKAHTLTHTRSVAIECHLCMSIRFLAFWPEYRVRGSQRQCRSWNPARVMLSRQSARVSRGQRIERTKGTEERAPDSKQAPALPETGSPPADWKPEALFLSRSLLGFPVVADQSRPEDGIRDANRSDLP